MARSAEEFLATGIEQPEDLEQLLRDEFPRVRVVPGVVDGSDWRWYVYRDGRWVNPEGKSLHSADN
jgi:hypothetical protein